MRSAPAIRPLPLLGSVGLIALLWTSSPSVAAPTIQEFPLPTEDSAPDSIVAGPDGTFYFTEYGSAGNAIGHMDASGHVLGEFKIPTPEAFSEGITVGPDGNIWFAEHGASKIGRATPAGTVTDFPTETPSAGPVILTTGPDGNIWFTEPGINKIGRMTPSGVPDGEFLIPTPTSTPWGIVAGPEKNLWFTEAAGNKVGVMAPNGSVLHEYQVPTAESHPEGITLGADGNLWFAESGANKIGRITPTGQITEFSIPTPKTEPFYLTAAPDGTIWFAENVGNAIGVVEPNGAIQEFPVPSPEADPYGITVGPECSIWFAEIENSPKGNRIGRLDRGGCPAPPDTTPPRLKVFGKTVRLLRRGTMTFKVESDEEASGLATGAISLSGRRVAKPHKRMVTFAADRRTKVTLQLRARTAAAVRNALRDQHLKLRVKLRVHDTAGNATAKRASFRLKR
jgi:streptogramin lyase